MNEQEEKSIDKLWDDVTLYQVQLELTTHRTVTRLLIFPAGLAIDMLKSYIIVNLPNVIKVDSVIELEDGWFPTREKLEENFVMKQE